MSNEPQPNQLPGPSEIQFPPSATKTLKTLHSVSWIDGSADRLGEGEFFPGDERGLPGFLGFKKASGDAVLLCIDQVRALTIQIVEVKQKPSEDGKVLPFPK